MSELLLVRHGETDWNRLQRWQGQADPPLNERGREQADELARALAGQSIEAIYASDLRRARETADIVAARLGLPVASEPGLREIDVGSWSGLTREEIAGRDWDGETKDAHRARVLAAVRRIVRDHPGGRVLVVTHGGSVRRIQEAVEGEADGVLPNCGLLRLRYDLLD